MKKTIFSIGLGLILVNCFFLMIGSSTGEIVGLQWYEKAFLIVSVTKDIISQISSEGKTIDDVLDIVMTLSFVVMPFIVGIIAGSKDGGVLKTVWCIIKYIFGLFLFWVVIIASILIVVKIYNAFMNLDILQFGVLIIFLGCFSPVAEVAVIILDID